MTGIEGLLYGIGFGVAGMIGITALVSRVNQDVPGDLGEGADEHEEIARPGFALRSLTDAELVRHVLAEYDPDSMEYELARRLEDTYSRIHNWPDYRGAGE